MACRALANSATNHQDHGKRRVPRKGWGSGYVARFGPRKWLPIKPRSTTRCGCSSPNRTPSVVFSPQRDLRGRTTRGRDVSHRAADGFRQRARIAVTVNWNVETADSLPVIDMRLTGVDGALIDGSAYLARMAEGVPRRGPHGHPAAVACGPAKTTGAVKDKAGELGFEAGFVALIRGGTRAAFALLLLIASHLATHLPCDCNSTQIGFGLPALPPKCPQSRPAMSFQKPTWRRTSAATIGSVRPLRVEARAR